MELLFFKDFIFLFFLVSSCPLWDSLSADKILKNNNGYNGHFLIFLKRDSLLGDFIWLLILLLWSLFWFFLIDFIY